MKPHGNSSVKAAITGGILTYNEKNYYVRGVYEDTNAVVILPAETVFAKKPCFQ